MVGWRPEKKYIESQRKQCNRLLGQNRNGDYVEKEHNWDDKEVCKFHLAGLCVHDLFDNTKLDRGPCPNVHKSELRDKYKESSRFGKMGYEKDLHSLLVRMIDECDVKISRHMKRINVEDEQREAAETAHERDPAVIKVTDEIKRLTDEAEKLGEEGEVDKSMELLKRAEALRVEKARLQMQIAAEAKKSINTSQVLRACDVCGALLSLTDSDTRLADHFSGKAHVGYQIIRDKAKELEQWLKDHPDHSSSLGSAAPMDAHRDGDRRRDYDRDRRRDYDRDRDRGRDRSRDYDRGRDRDRRRSRSPGGSRRSSSRDRKRARY